MSFPRELGTAYVFSWGWGVFNEAGNDPDKAGAACVWLWARDPGLCDAPASYRFDADLRAGQIDLPPGVRCVLDDKAVTTNEIGQLARVTGDAELALSALYARLVEQRAVRLAAGDVVAAERAIVAWRFGGSRAAYLAALTSAKASLAVARGAIGDELRRRVLEERLAPRRPASAAEVAEFLGTYGGVLAREVELDPAPGWLPNGRGVVLSTELSASVFAAPTGGTVSVTTFDGVLRVRALGEPTPLAALPAANARPAVARALRKAAQAEAYRDSTPAAAGHRARRASLHPRPVACGGRSRADELPPVSRPRGLTPRLRVPTRLRYHPLSGWPGCSCSPADRCRVCRTEVSEELSADHEPTRPEGPSVAAGEDEDACAARGAAEARRLHARLHDDPEEAEFGAAQGRARAADEPDGGHRPTSRARGTTSRSTPSC